MLRGACPRAALSADPWARNDTINRCHCEERSDEAIPPHRPTVGMICLMFVGALAATANVRWKRIWSVTARPAYASAARNRPGVTPISRRKTAFRWL
jgi:hypothetical protein